MYLVDYFVFHTHTDLVVQDHHHFRLTSPLMLFHLKGYVSLGFFGLQPSWCFSCCAGPHHHIRFLAAGQATLHGHSEHKNMILELDMPIGSWIVSSYCLLYYYCSFTILIFFPIFLFFLLPHCILPHDKDLRCLLFIIGFY